MNFEICLKIRSVIKQANFYYSTTLRAIVENCTLYAPRPAVGVIEFTLRMHLLLPICKISPKTNTELHRFNRCWSSYIFPIFFSAVRLIDKINIDIV